VAVWTVELQRDEAQKWIQREHDSDLQGIGTETWGAEARARFQESSQGKKDPFLAIIDAVRARADLTSANREALKSVPVTTVERLLKDRYVKEALWVWKSTAGGAWPSRSRRNHESHEACGFGLRHEDQKGEGRFHAGQAQGLYRRSHPRPR
jgi:hypothetical protein